MAGLVFTLGYLTLSVVTVLLFSLSFLQSVHEGLLLIPIIILLILVGLVIAQINEFLVCLVRHIKGPAVFDLQDFASILLVLAGAQVTFYLSVNLDLGNVLAASLTGILAALLLPKYAAAAYCGAFVGMSSPGLFATPMFILLAGIVAGALFVAAKTVFSNCGGKLGTIAFTGCIAASLLMDRPFISGSVPAWDTGALLVFYSVLAALTTRLISIRLKQGPIMGSAIVGLLGSLFLPVLHPERGSLLAVMAICASFAGMSDKERLPTEGLIALAGLFTALIFMFTSPYLGGAGGKLGTIAFGSVSSIQGMLAVFHVLKKNISARLPGS